MERKVCRMGDRMRMRKGGKGMEKRYTQSVKQFNVFLRSKNEDNAYTKLYGK